MISPSVCLLVLWGAPPAGAAPGGQRPAYNVPFERLKKSLLAGGWRLTSEPTRRDALTVKGIRERDGKVRPLPSKPVLTFSWVTLSGPRYFPPDKPASITVASIPHKVVDKTFVLADGRTTSFGLSPQCVRFTRTGKETMSKSITFRERKKNIGLTVVFLQRMVELVEEGKVVERWYLNEFATVAFHKEEKATKK